jgi:hypothetical protein
MTLLFVLGVIIGTLAALGYTAWRLWGTEGGIWKFGLILAGLAILIYAVNGFYFPSETIRYRLTLVIESDGTEHTGSGVIEVRYEKQTPLIAEAGGILPSVRGEAVAVDLGPRGTLFALLKGVESETHDEKCSTHVVTNPEQMLVYEFKLSCAVGDVQLADIAKLRKLGGHREIPVERLPMLARFRDLLDPATAEQVIPSHQPNQMGPGFVLKNATLTITSEPVTKGIEQRLPWMSDSTIMQNPGWLQLPSEARNLINGLRSTFR